MFLNNLYALALVAGLDAMEAAQARREELAPHLPTGGAPGHSIILTNRDIPGRLPPRLGDYQIEYLDEEGVAGRCDEPGGPLEVIRMRAVRKAGERRQISLTRHHVRRERGEVVYPPTDWRHVYLRYDGAGRECLVDEMEAGTY